MREGRVVDRQTQLGKRKTSRVSEEYGVLGMWVVSLVCGAWCGVWRCGVLRLRAAGPCAGDVATAGYAFFLLEDIKISPCGVWWSQQSAASASVSAMASASKKRSKRRHSVRRDRPISVCPCATMHVLRLPNFTLSHAGFGFGFGFG